MGLFKKAKAEEPITRFAVNMSNDKVVNLLFSPSIFTIAQDHKLDITRSGSTAFEVMAAYADILYCAACNYWVIDGNEMADAPFTRVDFHTFHANNPQEFIRVSELAITAFAQVVAGMNAIAEALSKQPKKK